MNLRRASALGLRLFVLLPFVFALCRGFGGLNGWTEYGRPDGFFVEWTLFLCGKWVPQSPQDGGLFYGASAALSAALRSWRFYHALSLGALFFFAGRVSILLNPDSDSLGSGWNANKLARLALQLSGAFLFFTLLSQAGEFLVRGIRAYCGVADSGGASGWSGVGTYGVLLGASLVLMSYSGTLARLVASDEKEDAAGPVQPGSLFLGLCSLLLASGFALGGWSLTRDPIVWRDVSGALGPSAVVREMVASGPKSAPTGFTERFFSSKILKIGGRSVSGLENELGTYFGKGSCPGQLSNPSGIAVAPNGDLYVSDTGNSRISVFDSSGIYRFSFGFPGRGLGLGGPGEFEEPSGVVVGADGTVYVADSWDHRIERFDAQGHYLGVWGGPGSDFFSPRAVAVDKNGLLYIADTGNSMIKILDRTGALLEVQGGQGSGWGQFQEVFGLAVNAAGEVYAADPGNLLIHKISAYPGGDLERYARVPGWSKNRPIWPQLSLDSNGRLYVSDGVQAKVFVYDQDLNYLATLDLSGLGPPLGLAAASDGGLWVAERGTGMIFKVTTPTVFGPPVDLSYEPDPLHFPAASHEAHVLFGNGRPAVKDDVAERLLFLRDHDKALVAGRFSDFEREADEDRRGHLTFADGDSRLLWLYGSLADYARDADRWGPSYYRQRLAWADQWDKQVPGSVTAQLYRAHAMLDYAWIGSVEGSGNPGAQAGGTASPPTLQQVWSLLDRLGTNETALGDPEYYCLRLHAGYGMGLPKQALTSWYEEGVSRCPGAWELAHWYCNGIAYKWGGGNLLPAFFRKLLRDDPIRALYVASYDQDNAFSDGSGYDGYLKPWDKYAADRETYWSDLQGAVQLAVAKYGTSAMALSRIAYVAATTGHYSDAAQVFASLGSRYEVRVWTGGYQYFPVKQYCLQHASDPGSRRPL